MVNEITVREEENEKKMGGSKPVASSKGVAADEEKDYSTREEGKYFAQLAKLTAQVAQQQTQFQTQFQQQQQHLENIQKQLSNNNDNNNNNTEGNRNGARKGKFKFIKCANCEEKRAFCTHCSNCGEGGHKRHDCPKNV